MSFPGFPMHNPYRKASPKFPTSYTEAAALLESARPIRAASGAYYRSSPQLGRKLANNTYLVADGDAFAVRLHWTNVVTFHPNGSIVLDTGGWQTSTTRDRIRACGIPINCTGGIVSVTWKGRDYAYRDGMVLGPRGRVMGHGGTDPEALRRERKRNLRRDPNHPRWATKSASEQWPGGNAPEATRLQ